MNISITQSVSTPWSCHSPLVPKKDNTPLLPVTMDLTTYKTNTPIPKSQEKRRKKGYQCCKPGHSKHTTNQVTSVPDSPPSRPTNRLPPSENAQYVTHRTEQTGLDSRTPSTQPPQETPVVHGSSPDTRIECAL